MRVPSHLYKNRFGTYYFRLVVPVDLRTFLPDNNHEIRRSLRTKDKSIAIIRCRYWSLRTTELLQDIKRMTLPKIKIDPRLISQFDLKGYSAKNTQHGVDISYDGLKVDFDDPADVEKFEKFEENIHKRLSKTAIASTAPSDKLIHKDLKEVVREFVDAHSANDTDDEAPAWNEKTTSTYISEYQLFIEIVGDPVFSEIGHTEINDYVTKVKRLPSNRKKIKKYREKPLSRFFEGKVIPVSDRLSITTTNKSISRISTLFEWAKNQGYTDKNYALKKQSKKKKRADEEKPGFTPEQLKAVFHNTLRRTKHSYYHWAPLIGLYTGARLNEICQLYLTDIGQVDNIWIFDFNDNTEDKRLKNLQSRRVIPVHSQLIKLGLLGHIQKLKIRREKRLFPELNHTRDGYAQNASKWFGRFLSHLEDKPEKTDGIHFKRDNVSFHSLRHTVANHLKNEGVDASFRAALLGHVDEKEGDSVRRYSGVYHPKVMQPIVETLDFSLNIEMLELFNKKEFNIEDYL